MREVVVTGGELELDLERQLVCLKVRGQLDIDDTIVALPLVLVRAIALKVYQLELAAELAAVAGPNGAGGPRLVGLDGKPV
jgi:hypothetical protein